MRTTFSCVVRIAMPIIIQILSAEIRLVQTKMKKTVLTAKSEAFPTPLSSNQTIPLKETNETTTLSFGFKRDSAKKFSFFLDSNNAARGNNTTFNTSNKQKAREQSKEKSLDLITNTDLEVLHSFVEKLKSSLVNKERDTHGLQTDNQNITKPKIQWVDRNDRYRNNGYGTTKANNELLKYSPPASSQQLPENSGRPYRQDSMTNSGASAKARESTDTVNKTLASKLPKGLYEADMDAFHSSFVKEWKLWNSTKTGGNLVKVRNSDRKNISENIMKTIGCLGSIRSTHIEENCVFGKTIQKKMTETNKTLNFIAVLKHENITSSLHDSVKQLKETVERAIANTTRRLKELLQWEKQLKRPNSDSNQNATVYYINSLVTRVKTMEKTLNLSVNKKEKENKEKVKKENPLELNLKRINETKNETRNPLDKQESDKPCASLNLLKTSGSSPHKHGLQKGNDIQQQQQKLLESQEINGRRRGKKEGRQNQQKQQSPPPFKTTDIKEQHQQRQQQKEQQQQQELNNQQQQEINDQQQRSLEQQRKSQSKPQSQLEAQLQPLQIHQQKQQHKDQHEQNQQQDRPVSKQEQFKILQNLASFKQGHDIEKASTLQTLNDPLKGQPSQVKVLKSARNFRLKTVKHLIASLMSFPFENWIYHQKTFDELGITPSLIKLGIANLGSSGPIRKIVRKALKGKTIKMMVIGGSISAGGGLGKDHGNTDGVYHKELSNWWQRTVTPVTGSDINVNNVAIGGTDCEYFSYCLNNFLQGNPDLVFWELSANDYNKYNERDFDPSKPLEQLTRLVLQIPSHPALIFVDFFRGDRQEFKLSEKCPDSEETEITVISRYYDIPWLSWRRMVCNFITKRTFVDRELFGDDGYHPSLLGHAQVATLLTMYIQGVFKSVLAKELENIEIFNDENDDFDLPDSDAFQLKIPIFKNPLNPKPCCWTLLTPDYTKNFSNTLNDVTVLEADGFEQNNVTDYEVRTDKVRCLLAAKPGATLYLNLDIPVLVDDKKLPVSNAQTRTLAIAIHNKYGGAADVQLDELPSKMSVVTERGSLKQTKVYIVSENVRPGVHNLRFRSLSSGFCLTSLMVL